MSKKILITSGPTRASLDAVRFLSNRSTGRFGTLLAQEALRRGARVTMVYGVGSETPPPHRHLRLVAVETNRDLEQTLKRELKRGAYDAVIHAMAVLDFRPEQVKPGKTGSRRGAWIIRLVPTEKIIQQIKKWAPHTLLVGFKLEVGVSLQELMQRGRRLLKESDADLVVANRLTAGVDSKHAGYLLDRQGKIVAKGIGKHWLARKIIAVVMLGRGL